MRKYAQTIRVSTFCKDMHILAPNSMARCVLYRYVQARTSPTTSLTRLRLDGILLCEAVSRSATFTPERAGLWRVKMRLTLSITFAWDTSTARAN